MMDKADLSALVGRYQAAARCCEYCGAAGVPIVIDHIVPKSRGGALTCDNLASACEPCNSRKAAQLGWVTLDGRPGAYDPATGPLAPIKRRKRGALRPTNPFEGHSGADFL